MWDWKAIGVLFSVFLASVTAAGTIKVLVNDIGHLRENLDYTCKQIKLLFTKADDQETRLSKLEGKIEILTKVLNGRIK